MSIRMLSMVGALGALVFAAGPVLAGPQATLVSYAWGSNPARGGPFLFQANAQLASQIQGVGIGLPNGAGPGPSQWITFCLEENEFINFGSTYDAVIGTAAVGGGNGNNTPGSGTGPYVVSSSGSGNDPLDARTAFLYSSFMNGTLHSLMASFTYGDGSSGYALQNAIWFLENEIGSVSGLGAQLVTLANSAVDVGGSWYGQGLGNVRVINLYDANGGLAQSQLVLIPLPGATGMAFAGLAGLGGVGFIRRRR